MSPCRFQDAIYACRTFKVYIASGNAGYHGELCEDCLWWEDTEADRAFKARIQEIKNPANFKTESRRP